MEVDAKQANDPPMGPKSRFTSRVDHYVRYRPGYPAGFIDVLRRENALPAGARVADIGSGTGISSRLFLDAGFEVWAVEPNREMRAQAENASSQNPLFHSMATSGEHTGLPDRSMDLVLCAQAFHWLQPAEAAAEFRRILKPAGRIALVWNERKLTGSAFLEGYEQLLQKYGTDYAAVARRLGSTDAFATLFGVPFTRHALINSQTLDAAGLRGRLLSASYVPNADNPAYQPMLKELDGLFERTQAGGVIQFEYETELFLSDPVG